MIGGGRRQISRGAASKYQYLGIGTSQLLDGKVIRRNPLIYLSGQERSFVPVWKVMEENRCENSTFLSKIAVVVDLHEESVLITQQIITNSITLS